MSQFENPNFAYLPATLKEYPCGWEIRYFCENPATGKLKRVRIRVDKIVALSRTKGQARKQIAAMVSNINQKLFAGFNPFLTADNQYLYRQMADVVDKYINEKKKDLRPDTIRSYVSFTGIFLTWFTSNCPGLFCSQVTHILANRFMDYLYNTRNVSPRTFNNYLKNATCLFDWMKEKGYILSNPFENVKMKRKTEKKRILIPSETRERIKQHLSGSPFLLVCMLVYHSLIRPKEIRNIKISDIDFDNHYIKIDAEVAKNHHTRLSAINSQIEELLNEHIKHIRKDWYLFSDVNTMGPGPDRLYDSKFTKEWNRVRKALHLPLEMQLYSFRDTGIFELLKNGVDDLSVMQHADHHSLDITTIYANHFDPNLVNIINKKGPQF